MLSALPLLTLVAALALTYVLCLRAMRRRACHRGGEVAERTRERERAAAELELLRLRQEDARRRGAAA